MIKKTIDKAFVIFFILFFVAAWMYISSMPRKIAAAQSLATPTIATGGWSLFGAGSSAASPRPTISAGTPTPDWRATAGAIEIDNVLQAGQLERTIAAGQATNAAIYTAQASGATSQSAQSGDATRAAETQQAAIRTATAYAPMQMVAIANAKAEADTALLRNIASAIGAIFGGAGALLVGAIGWYAVSGCSANQQQPVQEPDEAPAHWVINPEQQQQAESGEPTQEQIDAIRAYVSERKTNVLTFRAFVRESADGAQKFSRDEFQAFRGWAAENGYVEPPDDTGRWVTVLSTAGLAWLGE